MIYKYDIKMDWFWHNENDLEIEKLMTWRNDSYDNEVENDLYTNKKYLERYK